MRAFLVVSLLGDQVARRMLAAGVDYRTTEEWLLEWEAGLSRVVSGKPGDSSGAATHLAHLLSSGLEAALDREGAGRER